MVQLPKLSLYGIPIRTSWTWLLVALSLTAVTFSQVMPADVNVAAWVFWALVILAGTVLSVLIHDLGHVLAARQLGTSITYLEPSVLGALPDTSYTPETPALDVRVAVGGPVATLLLAGALWTIWLVAGMPDSVPGSALLILAFVNSGLAVLSFLPGYPFDGGRVFRAFLWFLTGDIVRSTRIAAVYGHVQLFLGLLGGVILLSMGEEWAVWGVWVLVLCWTINRSRAEGYLLILWNETGKSLRIDDLFQAGVNRVPTTATIDASIESLLDNFRRGPTLATDSGEVVGIIELDSVRPVPRARWTQVQVGEIMTPIDGLPRMDSATPVSELLAALPKGSTNVVLVEKHGTIVAAADREFVVERVEAYIRVLHFTRRRRR